jgi:predicted Zn-dependent protease
VTPHVSKQITKTIRRVGLRIVEASDDQRLQKFKWEFVVIQSPIANAFVLPAGKVVVFTGILPYMANEDGMATILGHEIAHVAKSKFLIFLFLSFH